MCLSRVKKVTLQEVKIGYKHFHEMTRYGANGTVLPTTEVRSACRNNLFIIGQWYNDVATGTIRANDGKQYPKGYHIFISNRGQGYSGSLYKVEYTDVVAEGEEGRRKVVIARKMRIVSKVR
jgi:hypothetical protein